MALDDVVRVKKEKILIFESRQNQFIIAAAPEIKVYREPGLLSPNFQRIPNQLSTLKGCVFGNRVS